MSQYHKKDFKHRHIKLIKGATKLALNLAILAGFGALIWYGYLLFTHKVAPLIGSIVFIVGIAVWVILIRILRSRYKWTKPSFKLTTFSVIAILLILTFAGVQPLASYKDNFIESRKTAQAEQAAERERAEAERAAEEARAEKYPKGLYIVTSSLGMNSYINFIDEHTIEFGNSLIGKDILKYELLEGETRIKATSLTDPAYDFEASFKYIKEIECVVIEGVKYFKTSGAQGTTDTKQGETKGYETLFNEYRMKNGLSPLVFSPRLNEIAQLRVEEIKKDFSHSGISKYGNFGENIVMGIYSDSEALKTWTNSLGHRSNMLDPGYSQTGYARSGGYAVQIFD
jgi:uncharacterized protein YkwD